MDKYKALFDTTKRVVPKVPVLLRGILKEANIQRTFNEEFADTEVNKECTLDLLLQSIDRLLNDNDTTFREILSNIPEP